MKTLAPDPSNPDENETVAQFTKQAPRLLSADVTMLPNRLPCQNRHAETIASLKNFLRNSVCGPGCNVRARNLRTVGAARAQA